MGRFQSNVLAVASILFFYLGFRLTSGESWLSPAIWLWLGFCFIMVLLLPFYFWSRRRNEMTNRQKFQMKLTQASMAYLNFLIALVLVRDFISVIAHFLFRIDTRSWYSPIANLIVIVLPLVLKAWGLLTIVRGPQVVQEELRDERLPKEFEGFRILQVSDLHICHSLKPGFVEKVLKKAEEAKPDLIVLTGDIVDGSSVEFRGEIAKLSKLRAPSGVMFVPGNHEYYWNFPEIRKELEKTGMSILINDGQTIRRGGSELWIAGVPDPASRSFHQEPPNFDKLMMQFRDRQYRVLLSHQPVLADAAAEAGFHLQFSGHTHAGQFFPWNLLIGFFQKYAKGFYRIGKLHLYVNQGTGYWGPALRVGTFCEMTELTLHV